MFENKYDTKNFGKHKTKVSQHHQYLVFLSYYCKKFIADGKIRVNDNNKNNTIFAGRALIHKSPRI